MDYKNPRVAFAQAIEEGRLSENSTSDNYAGKYMYMGAGCGRLEGKDAFKNIITREYDV